MDEQPVLFDRDGATVRLTLNRPRQGNAINLPLAQALLDQAKRCAGDDSIRCVVLTGAGRMFCAGGDIGDFVAAGDAVPTLLKDLTDALHAAVLIFAGMAKPLVTAINGSAAGAGLGLALLGDIAIAARSAQFTLGYGRIGLSPDGGTSWLLPRLIGLRRTQELALTGQRLSAEDAVAMDMVTRVVDDALLADEVRTVCQTLSSSATRALGRTRALLFASLSNSLETQLAREAETIVASGGDAECREGIAAFVAKRHPVFAG